MAKRTKWHNEPYKSVLPRADVVQELPIAIRKPQRKRFDFKEFVIVQFLRLSVLGVMVAFAGLYFGIWQMTFHNSIKPSPDVVDLCGVVGIGIMIGCGELAGLYAIIRMHKFYTE